MRQQLEHKIWKQQQNSTNNRFQKVRLSVRDIGWNKGKSQLKVKNMHQQRNSVPNFASHRYTLSKQIGIHSTNQQIQKQILYMQRNSTPAFKYHSQTKSKQLNNRHSMRSTGVLPSLNNVKLDPYQIINPTCKQSQTSIEVCNKKPNFLHNKSQKYVVQFEKLRQKKVHQKFAAGQKLFFIHNLMIDDFNQTKKLKTLESKTLIKFKQIERQKRNKNTVALKIIDPAPFELKTGKMRKQLKQLQLVNRYQYDDQLKGKLQKIRQQKERERLNVLLNQNQKNQGLLEGWNQSEKQDQIYLQGQI